jgi:uncharacterized phiE125 gp8 family phage protein
MHAIALDGPAVEPIPLAEMRAYLRLDGEGEDALVAGLVAAARLAIEAATRLALIAQTWRLRVDRWPTDGVVALPLAPVLSVDAVRLLPRTGAAVTFGPDLYRLDLSGDPARLLLDLPAARPQPGDHLEIDLTAGFGPGPESVPAPLRLAIRRLVARWFENRGDVASPDGPLDPDIRALLAPFVRPRLV